MHVRLWRKRTSHAARANAGRAPRDPASLAPHLLIAIAAAAVPSPAVALVEPQPRDGGGEAVAAPAARPVTSVTPAWVSVPARDFRSGPGPGAPPAGDPDRALRPVIGGPLSEGVFANVALAFRLAVSRIRTISTCGGLFAHLGADGVERLSRTVYLAPWGASAAEVCRHDVAAYTWLGDRRTVLCPGFGFLPVRGAAVVLIHEALHASGLGEAPSDRHAPAPDEINRAVMTACGL